jgi:hypothetical protein
LLPALREDRDGVIISTDFSRYLTIDDRNSVCSSVETTKSSIYLPV